MSNPATFWVCKLPSFAPEVPCVALCNLPSGANSTDPQAADYWQEMTETALAGWKNANLAAGWQPGDPLPPAESPPRVQETDIILQRLTATERQALFEARRTVWQIDYLITRATSTGTIHEDDPDFPTARVTLDQLGVIAAGRWDDLFVKDVYP